MVYKKYVYIGKPNQTRHLGDHHRRVKVLEQEWHTLLDLLKGKDAVTESPATLCRRGKNRHLCGQTPEA